MQRYMRPAALAAAFVLLLSSPVKATDEQVSTVGVQIVCDSKRVVEEHLALIEADTTYALVRERLREDMGAARCIQVPPTMMTVQEQGRQVTITDSDGDVMRITVVRIGESLWTLAGRNLGKGS